MLDDMKRLARRPQPCRIVCCTIETESHDIGKNK
jgi:methanogenic corrinoid protein MtbC1